MLVGSNDFTDKLIEEENAWPLKFMWLFALPHSYRMD